MRNLGALASLCISETWLSVPFPLVFSAQLLLIRDSVFQGDTHTHTLPTGHCIAISHIRLLKKQHFSIFWSRCLPSPSPQSPLHSALKKEKHMLITLARLQPHYSCFLLLFFFLNFNLNSFFFFWERSSLFPLTRSWGRDQNKTK